MTATESPPAQDGPFQLPPECVATILNPPAAWDAVLPLMNFRERVEDFQVDELPTYLPDGTGDHLFLWVEKTDTSASELISRISRHLDVAVRDIGVAGQKDRRAITRQFVSVPRSCESRLTSFVDSSISILSVSAHGNKLRTGHLKGNRFRITLRPQPDTSISRQIAETAIARLNEIQQLGFPNYYGPQRFGIEGSSLHDGIQLLQDPSFARRFSPQKRRFMKKMLPSAVQAGVFNMVLTERVADKTFRSPLQGDVVCSKTGIRPFALCDAAPNLTELVPMGPMPGSKMMPASQDIANMETRLMLKLGLTSANFAGAGKHTPGARRRMVAFPEFAEANLQADGSLQLQFSLSSGSFATVLLDQLGPVSEWNGRTNA